MADLRERAAQRLIEPGAIIDCVRKAVATFDDPGLSAAGAEQLARIVRERCDHADEVRFAQNPRFWTGAESAFRLRKSTPTCLIRMPTSIVRRSRPAT